MAHRKKVRAYRRRDGVRVKTHNRRVYKKRRSSEKAKRRVVGDNTLKTIRISTRNMRRKAQHVENRDIVWRF